MSVQIPLPLADYRQQINDLLEEINTHGASYGIREVADLEFRVNSLRDSISYYQNTSQSKLLKSATSSFKTLESTVQELSKKVSRQFFDGPLTRTRQNQFNKAITSIGFMGLLLKQSETPLDRIDQLFVRTAAQVSKTQMAELGPVPPSLLAAVNEAQKDVEMYVS